MRCPITDALVYFTAMAFLCWIIYRHVAGTRLLRTLLGVAKDHEAANYSLRADVSVLKEKDATLEADLSTVKQENVLLWSEVCTLKTRVRKIEAQSTAIICKINEQSSIIKTHATIIENQGVIIQILLKSVFRLSCHRARNLAIQILYINMARQPGAKRALANRNAKYTRVLQCLVGAKTPDTHDFDLLTDARNALVHPGVIAAAEAADLVETLRDMVNIGHVLSEQEQVAVMVLASV